MKVFGSLLSLHQAGTAYLAGDDKPGADLARFDPPSLPPAPAFCWTECVRVRGFIRATVQLVDAMQRFTKG